MKYNKQEASKEEVKSSGSTQIIKESDSKEALVVGSEFGNYKKGELIMEKSEINKILKGPFANSVNKILLG